MKHCRYFYTKNNCVCVTNNPVDNKYQTLLFLMCIALRYTPAASDGVIDTRDMIPPVVSRFFYLKKIAS